MSEIESLDIKSTVRKLQNFVKFYSVKLYRPTVRFSLNDYLNNVSFNFIY